LEQLAWQPVAETHRPSALAVTHELNAAQRKTAPVESFTTVETFMTASVLNQNRAVPVLKPQPHPVSAWLESAFGRLTDPAAAHSGCMLPSTRAGAGAESWSAAAGVSEHPPGSPSASASALSSDGDPSFISGSSASFDAALRAFAGQYNDVADDPLRACHNGGAQGNGAVAAGGSTQLNTPRQRLGQFRRGHVDMPSSPQSVASAPPMQNVALCGDGPAGGLLSARNQAFVSK
jgi:hypothetical protein